MIARVLARDELRPALAAADAAGATPLAERARRQLVASGLRPRRAAIEGAAALTPRQRDCAAAENALRTSPRPQIDYLNGGNTPKTLLAGCIPLARGNPHPDTALEQGFAHVAADESTAAEHGDKLFGALDHRLADSVCARRLTRRAARL